MRITFADYIAFSTATYNHYYIDYNNLTQSDTVIYSFSNFKIISNEHYKAPKYINLTFKEDGNSETIRLQNTEVDLLVIIQLLSIKGGFKNTIDSLKEFHRDYSFLNIKRAAEEIEEAQKCMAMFH